MRQDENYLARYIKGFFSYHYASVENVIDVPETFTQILVLDVAKTPKGMYELKLTSEWKHSLTNKQVHTRIRFNGGTWKENSQSMKDVADDGQHFYLTRGLHDTGESALVEVEMRKEDVDGQLDVQSMDIALERKGGNIQYGGN